MFSVKSGGAVTFTVIGRAAVTLPDVPVIVICDDLSAAEVAAEMVSVVPEVVLGGLKDAVTPGCNPDAVNATVPVNPFCETTVIAAGMLPPGATLMAVAGEVSLNPGAAVIVIPSVAVAEVLPDVAVMVAVAEPMLAADIAVRVSLPAPAKDAVTPLGRPPIDRAGEPLNPFWAVMVTVVVALAPCAKLKLPGDALTVKLGPRVTVRGNVTELVMLPEAPATVTLVVPAPAFDAAVNVAALVVAVLDGSNDNVTPVGKPVALRVTLPLNPFFGVTVRVVLALAPAATLKLGPEGAIEKPGAAVMVRLTGTVALSVPDFPVIVRLVLQALAVEAAVSVRVAAPVEVTAPNAAVTPLGKPAALNVTVPENPFCAVI
jgi:hypothetical protein